MSSPESSPSAGSTAQALRRNARRRLFRKKANDEATMSIMEHLKELRRRVIISAIAITIGTIIGFLWYQNSIFGIPTLGDLLRGPYCKLPPELRAQFTPDGECKLLATSPFEMFLLRMKVGALAGLVFSSPVWLTQIWRFVAPGLHKKEKRLTFSFVTVAVALFVAGAVLAYFVVSYGLEMLVTIGGEAQVAALTGDKYFSFLLALLLIFGISFEVPLFICGLNLAGLITYESIKGKRSYIVVGLFIFAAFLTPGQDPFSMLILAVALTILVEIAVQFCRINDKRKKKQRPDWLNVDDESAAPINAATPTPKASALDGSEGMTIGSSERIHASGPVTPSPRPVADRTTTLSEGTDFSDVL